MPAPRRWPKQLHVTRAMSTVLPSMEYEWTRYMCLVCVAETPSSMRAMFAPLLVTPRLSLRWVNSFIEEVFMVSLCRRSCFCCGG